MAYIFLSHGVLGCLFALKSSLRDFLWKWCLWNPRAAKGCLKELPLILLGETNLLDS